jgi:hypothetical protein
MTADAIGNAGMLPENISALVMDLIDNEIEIVTDAIEGIAYLDFAMTGLRFDFPNAVVSLNATLREHSMQIDVFYDASSGENFSVRVKMYGQEEHYREMRSIFYATYFAQAHGLAFDPNNLPVFEPDIKTTTWCWLVPSHGQKADSFSLNIKTVLSAIAETTYWSEDLLSIIESLMKIEPDVERVLATLPDQVYQNLPTLLYGFLALFPDEFRFYAMVLQADQDKLQSNPEVTDKQFTDPSLLVDEVATDLLTALRSGKAQIKSGLGLTDTKKRLDLAEKIWSRDIIKVNSSKSEVFDLLEVSEVQPDILSTMPEFSRGIVSKITQAFSAIPAVRDAFKGLDYHVEKEYTVISALAIFSADIVRFELITRNNASGSVTLRCTDKPRPGLPSNRFFSYLRNAHAQYIKLFAAAFGIHFSESSEPIADRESHQTTWALDLTAEMPQSMAFVARLSEIIDVILDRNYTVSGCWDIAGKIQGVVPNMGHLLVDNPPILASLPSIYRSLLDATPQTVQLYLAIAESATSKEVFEFKKSSKDAWGQMDETYEVASMQILKHAMNTESDFSAQILSLSEKQKTAMYSFVQGHAVDTSGLSKLFALLHV